MKVIMAFVPKATSLRNIMKSSDISKIFYTHLKDKVLDVNNKSKYIKMDRLRYNNK